MYAVDPNTFANSDQVTNYYEDSYGNLQAGKKDEGKWDTERVADSPKATSDTSIRDAKNGELAVDDDQLLAAAENTAAMQAHKKKHVEPYPRFIG